MQLQKNKKHRSRKIIFLIFRFDNSVKAKIDKEFLNFHKDNDLQKIFNKGTIRLWYSCMHNINSIINSHNHKLLRCNNTTKTCNFRNETICHFNGECLFKGVYKATTINGNETNKYYGSTEVSLKKRYTQHKHIFKSVNSPQTTLPKYVRRTAAIISK